MTAAGWYKRVFKALCTRDMNELARVAFDVLHMPVVVTDAAFIVRAKYPDKPLNDEQWDANVMNRQIEPRFVKTFTEDNHFEQHDIAGKAILTDWGHYESAPRLTAEIKAHGNLLGYFAALTTGVDVRDWHYEAADVISEAFSMMMEADAGARLTRSGMASPVLYSLLDGSIDPNVDSDILLDSFAEENVSPYILFCAKPRNPHNAPLEAYLGNALARYFEHSVQTIYDGCLYILASEVSHDARGSVRSKLFTEEIEKQDLDCGASRTFSNIFEIPARGWEARLGLTVGLALNPTEYLHHYEDYIAEAVLHTMSEQLPEGALEHPVLAEIKRLDERNHTEYFKTLKMYYACQFDKKRTSERLHVHRNTLQYRLDRLAEIPQFNIDEPYLSLYFAIDDYQRRVAEAKAKSKRERTGR